MQATQDVLQPALDLIARAWRFAKTATYNTLAWSTSWLYLGLGAFLGLTLGTFEAVSRYWATVLADGLEWAGIQPPQIIRQAQKIHFGKDALEKASTTLTEKVPAAKSLVEGISPSPAGPSPLQAAQPAQRGADVAQSTAQYAKEKASRTAEKAAEAAKKVPAAIPGLSGAVGSHAAMPHTSVASSGLGSSPSTAHTQVYIPGKDTPINISLSHA